VYLVAAQSALSQNTENDTCTHYAELFPHSETVFRQSKMLLEESTLSFKERRNGTVVNLVEDAKAFPEIDYDPLYLLVSGYNSILLKEYSLALGLAEISTLEQIRNPVCEAHVFSVLTASLRYAAVLGLVNGDERKLSGFELTLSRLTVPPTYFPPILFEDSMCWLSNMGNDFILSKDEKRLCK
jgi:hypothetical protein